MLSETFSFCLCRKKLSVLTCGPHGGVLSLCHGWGSLKSLSTPFKGIFKFSEALYKSCQESNEVPKHSSQFPGLETERPGPTSSLIIFFGVLSFFSFHETVSVFLCSNGINVSTLLHGGSSQHWTSLSSDRGCKSRQPLAHTDKPDCNKLWNDYIIWNTCIFLLCFLTAKVETKWWAGYICTSLNLSQSQYWGRVHTEGYYIYWRSTLHALKQKITAGGSS